MVSTDQKVSDADRWSVCRGASMLAFPVLSFKTPGLLGGWGLSVQTVSGLLLTLLSNANGGSPMICIHDGGF